MIRFKNKGAGCKSHDCTFQRVMVLVFLSVFSIGIWAQSKITGTVVDAAGEPIIGASVVVKGTSNGAVTDLNGNFTIPKGAQNATLTISYVGYSTQNVATNGRQSVKVVLQENRKVLDEVVVVGYGTMKKSDMTGAISSGKDSWCGHHYQ